MPPGGEAEEQHSAAKQAGGMDYEHVTAEEQVTLSRDQCNFLERKRQAAASRS